MRQTSSGAVSTVAGIATLRLVAAAWVTLSHGARPPLAETAVAHPALGALAALNNGLFNGVAAVMMFFVISGFVIHLPQAGGRALDPLEHFARRLVRIAPPALFAYFVYVIVGSDCTMRFEGILWSIWCEIAYYLLYPSLLPMMRRFGTDRLIAVTTGLSLAMIVATWPTLYHSELSLVPLVAIGLPSWLLGCRLAEIHVEGRLPSFGNPWVWRGAAVVLSAAMKVPVTHGPVLVGYPAGHWLFAIFCFFWLGREIEAFKAAPPRALFERLGEGSYSLYLVHIPIILTTAAVATAVAPPEAGGIGAIGLRFLVWGLCCGALVVGTWGFYRLIELPFHHMARRLGRMARDRGRLRVKPA
jgi:peptidoglycan/LPS O-acetylase OafA/YrhL